MEAIDGVFPESGESSKSCPLETFDEKLAEDGSSEKFARRIAMLKDVTWTVESERPSKVGKRSLSTFRSLSLVIFCMKGVRRDSARMRSICGADVVT